MTHSFLPTWLTGVPVPPPREGEGSPAHYLPSPFLAHQPDPLPGGLAEQHTGLQERTQVTLLPAPDSTLAASPVSSPIATPRPPPLPLSSTAAPIYAPLPSPAPPQQHQDQRLPPSLAPRPSTAPEAALPPSELRRQLISVLAHVTSALSASSGADWPAQVGGHMGGLFDL
jgi:hypothetical protein